MVRGITNAQGIPSILKKILENLENSKLEHPFVMQTKKRIPKLTNRPLDYPKLFRCDFDDDHLRQSIESS